MARNLIFFSLLFSVVLYLHLDWPFLKGESSSEKSRKWKSKRNINCIAHSTEPLCLCLMCMCVRFCVEMSAREANGKRKQMNTIRATRKECTICDASSGFFTSSFTHATHKMWNKHSNNNNQRENRWNTICTFFGLVWFCLTMLLCLGCFFSSLSLSFCLTFDILFVRCSSEQRATTSTHGAQFVHLRVFEMRFV